MKLTKDDIDVIASRIKEKYTYVEKRDELFEILLNEKKIEVRKAVEIVDDLAEIGIYELEN